MPDFCDEKKRMKAFVIISGHSPEKNGIMVSVISAFASIDSIGAAASGSAL